MEGAEHGTTWLFTNDFDQQHHKKNKAGYDLSKIPIELRYAVDPENTNSSWKFAAGIRVGLLLSAYYKGKTWQNDVNQTQGKSTP